MSAFRRPLGTAERQILGREADVGLGWTLDSAWSISSSNGYIVGIGTLNGQQRGFLLSLMPSAPEPASWARMLVGFGAIGAAMRRGGRSALRFG